MLSRARIFAAVTVLVSCLAGQAAWGQAQNLEAGKSASQLFTGTCNACHKSPRGLLKTVSPGSLPGFLREHYTTSSDMASQLSSFLISNGASDSRQAKPGADKPGSTDQADRQGRKNRNLPPQEAARPDDGPPPGESGRQARKRLAHPGEPAEEARPAATTPAQAAIERGPDGRRLKRSGRPGRPGTEEPSMANEPPRTEPSKTEPPKAELPKNELPKTEPSKADSGMDDKARSEPKEETGNAERGKPDAEGRPGNAAATIESPNDNASGEKPVVRRDPVPPVTPASPAAASTPAPAPAIVSGGSSEPVAPAAPRPPAAAPPAESSAVTASAPPPLPAGPPTPPISQ